VLVFLLSVPNAVGIRHQLSGRQFLPGSVPRVTLRQGSDAAIPPSVSIPLHGSNVSVPLPGLQISAHASHEGSTKKQPALLDVAHSKRKWTAWSSLVAQNPLAQTPKGVWAHPTAPGDMAPGIQYPYESLAANQTFNNSMRGGGRANHSEDNYLGNHTNGTPIIVALAGGTGASIGGTGSANVDRDLLRRMHYQDKAVMLLVLVVYMVALAFSVSLTYRQASNNSPVTYYADPRFHNLLMEGNDLDVFLHTFNQAPKNISLRVAGFVPVADDVDGNTQWRGENYQTAFTFSLDLSPWMVRETQTVDQTSPLQPTRTLHDGVLPEDRSSLNYVLTSDNNDLGYVEIVKHVKWPDWEELATNIKHRIRQSGFNGVISVDRGKTDEMHVYKNKPWANFMHARATRVLCALSIFGWLIYVPYMWLRCKSTVVRSYYRVDVDISEYWPLISDKLTADGFEENRHMPIVSNA